MPSFSAPESKLVPGEQEMASKVARGWLGVIMGQLRFFQIGYFMIWGCIKTNLAIFGGMNIHLPVIWGSLGYQGFDSYPYVNDISHFRVAQKSFYGWGLQSLCLPVNILRLSHLSPGSWFHHFSVIDQNQMLKHHQSGSFLFPPSLCKNLHHPKVGPTWWW